MRLIAPAILLVLCGCSRTTTARDAEAERAGLAMGGLAAIPATATDVRSETVGNMFARSFAFKFSASVAEIEKFLASSPRLAGIAPDKLTEQHQYIPYEQTAGNAAAVENHAVFFPHREFPWFVPAVRVQGRRYVIPQDREAVGGEVVVDDAQNTVYVLIDRS